MGKPKIRFKGYEDDWEQRKLGEVSESYSGGTPSVGNKSYYGGSIPFIRSAEINSESTELFLTEEGLTNSSARMVSKGDILYALYGATSGETGRSRINGAINQAILAILPHDGYDSEFLMQWLRKSKQNITDIYLQGGQGNLSGAIVKALEVNFPSLAEQRQIGNYFQSIDKLITLHQRKCEETKSLKKYMLQKMFPENGNCVPKIRFSGFADAWEQRKFADMAIRESAVQTASQEIPGVEYDDVVVEEGCLNKDISSKETKKSGILFDGSQVLYGKLRPYLHNWLNPDFKGVAVGDWWVLKPIDLNKNFLYRLIQTQQFDNIANQSAGSKMPRADWNLISNSAFMVPFSNEEQSKIGDYFLSLDHLITLHQHKCDELQKLKKFMLQNMFV